MKRETTQALLIAGGSFALLALAVGVATRSRASSGSTSSGTGALPQASATTRASCLECVEKHLGAALVLAAEERDGYPYRLRVIGHLHEAEDESQLWPALHNAIREARKRYQQTGQAPDFDRLTELVTQAVAAQAA